MKSYDPAPKIASVVADVFWAVQQWDNWYQFGYRQPGPTINLESRLQQGLDWFFEAGYQHSTATYLKLLHAPPVNIAQAAPLHLGAEVRWDVDFADVAADG